MKRFSILIISLTLVILPMAAQDATIKGTITLSHQGNETSFAYNEMIKVMDAAEDGDTVLLSTGYFQGDFIMTKRLAFIGSGADTDKGRNNYTYYDGRIVINLPADTKLTARLFDCIYFFYNSNITFESAIDNVIFRKCCWDYNIFSKNTNVNYMLVDRCRCELNSDYSFFKKLVVRNSYVGGTPHESSGSENVFFYNCNICSGNTWDIGYNNKFSRLFYGTFRNCILSNDDCYITNPNDPEAVTVLINCLYTKRQDYVDAGCSLLNCYTYTSTNKDVCNFTKEELLSGNYLGTDGTVVGMYGGKNPYTLSPTNKEVTNKFHLDRDNKKIQFNIKVSDQQ